MKNFREFWKAVKTCCHSDFSEAQQLQVVWKTSKDIKEIIIMKYMLINIIIWSEYHFLLKIIQIHDRSL